MSRGMDFQGHLFVFMLCTLEYESSLSLSNPRRRRTPLRFSSSRLSKKGEFRVQEREMRLLTLVVHKGAASIEYRGEREATAVLPLRQCRRIRRQCIDMLYYSIIGSILTNNLRKACLIPVSHTLAYFLATLDSFQFIGQETDHNLLLLEFTIL